MFLICFIDLSDHFRPLPSCGGEEAPAQQAARQASHIVPRRPCWRLARVNTQMVEQMFKMAWKKVLISVPNCAQNMVKLVESFSHWALGCVAAFLGVDRLGNPLETSHIGNIETSWNWFTLTIIDFQISSSVDPSNFPTLLWLPDTFRAPMVFSVACARLSCALRTRSLSRRARSRHSAKVSEMQLLIGWIHGFCWLHKNLVLKSQNFNKQKLPVSKCASFKRGFKFVQSQQFRNIQPNQQSESGPQSLCKGSLRHWSTSVFLTLPTGSFLEKIQEKQMTNLLDSLHLELRRLCWWCLFRGDFGEDHFMRLGFKAGCLSRAWLPRPQRRSSAPRCRGLRVTGCSSLPPLEASGLPTL